MNFAELRELQTDRLTLRRLSFDDLYDYYERLGSDGEVSKYMLFEPHQDIGETLALIEEALVRYEEENFYRWGIENEDGLIGVIELLRFDEEAESCSFAYMIGENFWGKGYGTEALRAALDFAFAKIRVRVEDRKLAKLQENVIFQDIPVKRMDDLILVLPGRKISD